MPGRSAAPVNLILAEGNPEQLPPYKGVGVNQLEWGWSWEGGPIQAGRSVKCSKPTALSISAPPVVRSTRPL